MNAEEWGPLPAKSEIELLKIRLSIALRRATGATANRHATEKRQQDCQPTVCVGRDGMPYTSCCSTNMDSLLRNVQQDVSNAINEEKAAWQTVGQLLAPSPPAP